MLELPMVSLTAFATTDHFAANRAFEYSQRGINFGDKLVITDKPEFFPTATQVLVVPPLPSYQEGCIFHCTQAPDLILPVMRGTHLLSVQWDSPVLNPEAWTDEFLAHSFCGAVMNGFAVGNHGAALFGRDYYTALKMLGLPAILSECHPCDQIICIRHHDQMVRNGCKFAPVELARRFSRENDPPYGSDVFMGHGKLYVADIVRQGRY